MTDQDNTPWGTAELIDYDPMLQQVGARETTWCDVCKDETPHRVVEVIPGSKGVRRALVLKCIGDKHPGREKPPPAKPAPAKSRKRTRAKPAKDASSNRTQSEQKPRTRRRRKSP